MNIAILDLEANQSLEQQAMAGVMGGRRRKYRHNRRRRWCCGCYCCHRPWFRKAHKKFKLRPVKIKA